MSGNLIHFDWAMKRLLRDKSNYVVLEGFLSTLLGEDLHICRFLESESNQSDANNKFNRADILVEDTAGRLLIIEVQNNRELDYFHRMLYGVSKSISEYINLGDDYDKVRKVYSINIVYFDLGQGKDYIYHGKTVFRGLHDPNDVLRLSPRQREIFIGDDAGDIFTEYYVLRVNDYEEDVSLERELVLMKLPTPNRNTRDEVRSLCEIFSAKIIDVTAEVYTVQFVGSAEEVDNFIATVGKCSEILETVRSGVLGIAKGNHFMHS